MNEPRRPPARAPRGAAARHEPGQRPLPDRLRQLERGAARRARRRPALHATSATPRPRGRSRASRSSRPQRDLLRDLAERSSGRVGFEADVVPYASVRVAARGRARARAAHGRRRGAARGQGRGRELEPIRRAAEIADQAFERFAEEPFVGRSERELAWRLDAAPPRARRRRAALRHDRRRQARTARCRTRVPTDRPIEPGETLVDRRGRQGRRLLLRLHAHVRDGPASRPSSPDAYDVCLDAQLAGARRDPPGHDGVDADAERARA